MSTNHFQKPETKGSPEKTPLNKANLHSSHKQLFFELYNRAIADDKLKDDHQILQKQSYLGLEEAASAKRIFDGELEAISTPRFTKEDSWLEEHRKNVSTKQKELYKRILDLEPLFKMQESRRLYAEVNVDPEHEKANVREVEADDYRKRGLELQRTSTHTKEMVKSFRIYKEYVQKGVSFFGKEANSVEGVVGRFRDLLTLRTELMCKADKLLGDLQVARFNQLEVIRKEKVSEGEALLQLYSNRNNKWESNKKMDEVEGRLRTLQAISTEATTNLTRVRLALSNMYSVARTYQKSLPPITPDTNPKLVLKRLHHFLQDASTVTREADIATGANSMVPAKGSDLF